MMTFVSGELVLVTGVAVIRGGPVPKGLNLLLIIQSLDVLSDGYAV